MQESTENKNSSLKSTRITAITEVTQYLIEDLILEDREHDIDTFIWRDKLTITNSVPVEKRNLATQWQVGLSWGGKFVLLLLGVFF